MGFRNLRSDLSYKVCVKMIWWVAAIHLVCKVDVACLVMFKWIESLHMGMHSVRELMANTFSSSSQHAKFYTHTLGKVLLGTLCVFVRQENMLGIKGAFYIQIVTTQRMTWLLNKQSHCSSITKVNVWLAITQQILTFSPMGAC